jgi:hypothetical protein
VILTCGPELSAGEKREEGELGRQLGSMGRAGARRPRREREESEAGGLLALWPEEKRKDGPGEKGAGWAKSERRGGREVWRVFLFFFFKLLSLNPFSNFSRFKLFSKIFKTI